MSSREWPVPKEGDQGQVVRTLQHLLNFHGAGIATDGIFGPSTAKAVSGFQTAKDIDPDGAVGPETWEALVVNLALGDSGDAVRAAQTQLYIRGTLPAVDGVYSMKTDISVRRFQTIKQLPATGVVDRATWLAMVSDTELPAISQDLSRDSFDWQAKLRSMLRPEG